MPDITIKIRATRAQVNDFMRDVPLMLTGKKPDSYGLGKACLTACIDILLKKLREEFIAKSLGSAGSDGSVWNSLSKTTRELRARNEFVSVSPYSKGTKLDHKEQFAVLRSIRKKRREQIIKDVKTQLMGMGYSKKEADKIARGRANYLPLVPASFKKSPVYDWKILIDTARLLASVSPGRTSGSGLAISYQPNTAKPAQAGDQKILMERPGELGIKFAVPYGKFHQYYPTYNTWSRKPLPHRPFVPGQQSFPQAWKQEIAQAYQQALAKCILEILPRLS